MKMTGEDLFKFGNEKFTNHSAILPLWQTMAEHFYPERSDFTTTWSLGSELGVGLASSQPVLIRRDLGNSFGAMLRDGSWFNMGIDGDPDLMGKMWLEFATQRMFKLMNHRSANFRRATKQGDHDYATFGNAVISIELNKKATGLIYRNWHMKDCAWWDNDEEQVDGLVRKWCAKVHEVQSYFNQEGDKIPVEVEKKITENKLFDEVNIMHFDITTEMYGHDKWSRFERVSIFLDTRSKEIIRIVGKNYKCYVVPRFQTIAGSPYAISPATMTGLPEARTLQAMTHTLLEAGERIARPPLIAREKVIRGDANLFSDGMTYVSEKYDGRLGPPIETLETNSGGFPWAMDQRVGVIEVLQSAFYLNKIALPETGHEMTAYEVQERMKQYRRENLPLFAPIEHDYNGQLCEVSFQILQENGLLGSWEEIPQSLSQEDVIFKFESPLSLSEEEKKATQFSQVAQLLRDAVEFEETASLNINFDEALRDAVEGVGAPAKWLTQVDELSQRREQYQQEKQAMIEAGMDEQKTQAA